VVILLLSNKLIPMDYHRVSKVQISSLKGEIETIKEHHHPNIISYYGTQQTLNKINIFLEYADRGSLRQFYQKKGSMSESQVINCTRQILNGLQYLYDKGMAHRDIKCANCLLTQRGVVKLADFGASKRFESVSGLKGTPNWMAPEVIKGTQMTSGWLKADVWSVGCTPYVRLDAHPLLIKKSETSPLPLKVKLNQQLINAFSSYESNSLNNRDNLHCTEIADDDEVHEELQVQECTTDLIDEVESVEDETETVEQDHIPIIYSEESSQVSNTNISFLSEVNHETPPRDREKSLLPKESLSTATSTTQSNSGSLTESSSSVSYSRKGFPKPFRLSGQMACRWRLQGVSTSACHLDHL
jgi:serine/threonine protein kinase